MDVIQTTILIQPQPQWHPNLEWHPNLSDTSTLVTPQPEWHPNLSDTCNLSDTPTTCKINLKNSKMIYAIVSECISSSYNLSSSTV